MHQTHLYIARDGYEGDHHTEVCTQLPTFHYVPVGDVSGPKVLTLKTEGKRFIVTDKQLEWLFGMTPLQVGEIRKIAVGVECIGVAVPKVEGVP